MTTDRTKLTKFAEQYDGSLDTLSLDEAQSLNHKLVKRDLFAKRGIDARADTLAAEVADEIGAEFDRTTDGDRDVTTDTLSRADVSAALDRVVDTLGMDGLHARHRVEEHKKRLEKKQQAFQNRDMQNRAEDLAAEITVLEAAHAETRDSEGRYTESDVDTLAARVARDGYVLETNADGRLTARKTGGVSSE